MNFNEEFEYVFYNANRNFTLQYQLIMSAVDFSDSKDIIERKIKIVSCFIDQYITRRAVNYKVIEYSSIKNTVFTLTNKCRRKPIDKLKEIIINERDSMEYTLDGIKDFSLISFTIRYMPHIFARITYYVEKNSDIPTTSFVTFIDRNQKNSYYIEHILGDDYQLHQNNFVDEEEFGRYRNMSGALLLKDKNRSIKASPYAKKLRVYIGENLLAKSLCYDCYNNPRFKRFIDEKNLNFEPYLKFDKKTINERQRLYTKIAKAIWDINLIKNM